MAVIKKLAVTINAFDSSELLEPILSEIRDQVDHIIAIWQKKSYWGNPMDEEDMAELRRLQSLGLIDELLEFKGDMSKYSREQECDKRNFGINYVKERGFSHVLNIDADECYNKEDFIKAKDIINKNGYTVTYCNYINYYKDFYHYQLMPFVPGVPFIHHTHFNYKYNINAPIATDPTRRIYNPMNLGLHIFSPDIIRMHHASWLRKDIRKKLKNWSAKNHFPESLVDKAVKHWETWKDGDDAILLFNVPDNKVTIKKLDQRLCGIKFSWLI